MENIKQKYFAAANTSEGFKSFFPYIFDPDVLNRIYVIKGGPGTGKSTVMKRVADEAERRGYNVVYYYCSSDTNSLDGIVIPKLKAAMLDGTSPHMTDPKYPGAVEEIFDIYPFFNTNKLVKRKKEIIDLSKENSKLHKSSGTYLSYAGCAAKEALYVINSCIDAKKLKAAAKRLASTVKGEAGKPKLKQISAFSTQGKVVFDTFSQMAKKKIAICDEHGSAYTFTKALAEALNMRGVSYYYSISTLLPYNIEAIFVPSDNVLFEITDKADKINKDKYYKIINMKRFVNTDKLCPLRARLRLCEKIKTELEKEAERKIRLAGEVHDKIERIYKNAVDFDGVKEQNYKLMDKIFK